MSQQCKGKDRAGLEPGPVLGVCGSTGPSPVHQANTCIFWVKKLEINPILYFVKLTKYFNCT